MTYDPFAVSSGLIDSYSGTVIESWFGINPRYSETAHLLFWKIRLDNPELYPQIDDGEIQEQFTVGDKWESEDGGESVTYPDNPQKNFNANTQYGIVISRAVNEWDLRSTLEGKGVPSQARIWEGLRFEFGSEILTKPFKGSDGNMVTPKPKIMPIKYLGNDVEAVPERAFDISVLELTIDQESELRAAAESSSSYGEFLDAAMKLQWVAGDSKMVSALADQSLWQAISLM